MATASEVVGSAATVLAAIIEMIVSDQFFQGIIAGMQSDNNRQQLTEDERARIKMWMDGNAKSAQDAIDAMPEDGA